MEQTTQPTLQDVYENMLDLGQLAPDGAQSLVVAELQELQNALHQTRSDSRRLIPSIYRKIARKRNPKMESQGMYLFGGVGRGKSTLMDLFFETCRVKRKRRVHFHAFMLEVHQRLRESVDSATDDKLAHIAQDIASETWLLCFDEFQVLDIADAMILSRLFETLFDHGIVVIATSNRPPDDLYKDGLHRDRFLPFIELLKQKLETIPLDSKTDYRTEKIQGLQTTWFHPLGQKADQFIYDSFLRLTKCDQPSRMTLPLEGRTLHVERYHGDVAWFSFAELCEKPLGAKDYIELSRIFNTFLIMDIPLLSMDNHNAAKRFVTLIDTLYERKVNIVASAASEPQSLYPTGKGAFEFERTVSRLIEMQSEDYIKV